MTKNWARFPIEEPTGEDLSNFSAYRLYERSAIAGYGVLSGCVTSRSSATAVAVSSGVYTVSGVKADYAGGSLTSISAATAGKQRYDLVYIDGADATLKLCAGVEDTPDVAGDFLENYKPRPAEPTDTDWICLAVIRVTESGIEAANFGTNVYATNSVANLYLSPAFAVDNSTLQVVDGVASVKIAYVKADGTVGLSADWDAGSYKVKALTLESDQTTGTAPLAVASTTKVNNLNVDQVDGKDETAFALLAGRSGGQTLVGGTGASENLTLSSTSNGTKGKITTADQIETTVGTGTAPLAISSTTKVNNLNVDQVDSTHATATATASSIPISDGSGFLAPGWSKIAVWGPYRITHDGGASQAILTTPDLCEIEKVVVKCQEAGSSRTVNFGWAADTDALMADSDVPKTLNGVSVNRYPTSEITSATALVATVGGSGNGEWDVWLVISRFT